MAADPLESLLRQIVEATALPAPEPFIRSGDPLDRLLGQLRPGAANDDRPPAPAPAPATGGGIESVLGRELLQMAASTPLPAAAREEAIRRLGVAVENPSAENVRAVLRVLVTGRADA